MESKVPTPTPSHKLNATPADEETNAQQEQGQAQETIRDFRTSRFSRSGGNAFFPLPEGLHPIQQAFVDNFGLQCGYCTPGMTLLTKALLDENPHPSHEEIVRYIGGNICRCTGYAGILTSVDAAAKGSS